MQLDDLDLYVRDDEVEIRRAVPGPTAYGVPQWRAGPRTPLERIVAPPVNQRVQISVDLRDAEQRAEPGVPYPYPIICRLAAPARFRRPIGPPIGIGGVSWLGPLAHELELLGLFVHCRPERRQAAHVWHLARGQGLDEIARMDVSPILVVIEYLADWSVFRELERIGCLAIIATETPAEVVHGLAHDRDLDWIVSELRRRGRVRAAIADGAERLLSLRRAVLHEDHSGLSAVQILEQPRRVPRTELETFLASRATGALSQLAGLADAIQAMTFSDGHEGAIALAEMRRAIGDVVNAARIELTWQRGNDGNNIPESVRGSRSVSATLPDRALDAKLHRDGVPLRGGVVADQPFNIDVSILFATREVVGFAVSLEELQRRFGNEEELPIDLVVWTVDGQFDFGGSGFTQRVKLPRLAESPVARFELVARLDTTNASEVRRQVRICAYHENALLQSLALNIAVGRNVAPRAQTTSAFDYRLTGELMTVPPSRAVSIFVTDTAGTHRIGVRTADGGDDGKAIELPPATAHKLTRTLRAMIHVVAGGHAEADRFAQSFDTITDGERTERAARFVELADRGAMVYTSLGLGPRLRRQLAAFDKRIEISRIPGAAELPWQLVYDLPLAAEAKICPSYTRQLWRQGQYLLDDPRSCASQDCCPHRQTFGGSAPATGTPEARSVVCPFGFWGTRHAIAQPLGAVDIPPGPPPSGASEVVAGYYQFENATDHIARLAPAKFTSNRNELLDLLAKRRDAVIYLYCHGRTLQPTDRELRELTAISEFVLEVGDAQTRQQLRARDLQDLIGEWQHGPIVILNGCETLQIYPEGVVNDFLGVLRTLGASAIVGPDIEMFTTTAALAGELLVAELVAGQPLDAAVLSMRRQLLGNLSPMGLAYNVYAPSALCIRREERHE